MTFAEEFQESMASVEDALGQTMTWAGTEYPCHASGVTRASRADAGLWNVTDDLTISVRAELFTGAQPLRDQTLTHAGSTYRISTVMTAPGNTFLRLTCVYEFKGA